jgi:nucleotide-binding universal stress UspA family protein
MNVLGRVLLALDLEATTNDVVSSAIALAKSFESVMIPVYVLPAGITDEKARRLVRQAAEQRLQEVVSRLSEEGLKSDGIHVIEGHPSQVIPKAAIDLNVSLVFLGNGQSHRGENDRLGTTAKRIIQNSEKPVLVAKTKAQTAVNHILCPVDFSRPSKSALNNAIAMARRFQCKLTIMAVCELEKLPWYAFESDLEEERNSQLAMHKEAFDAFLKQFNLHDLDVATISPMGDPAGTILNTIKELSVDFLVMGTTGRTGIHRWVLGSVTEKVIRDVPCSFLTVKSDGIFSLHFERNLKDIERLKETSAQLMADGYYTEAADQLKECIRINQMYIPAYQMLVKLHEKMEQQDLADHYRARIKEINERLWFAKIEEEVRSQRNTE